MKAFRKGRFSPLALFPLAVFLFMGLMIIYYLANKDKAEIEMGINLIFMIIGAVLSLFLAADIFFRKESSHIALIIINGAYVTSYGVVQTIRNATNHVYGGMIFYALASIFSAILIYFYIKKALDGDANLKFILFGGLTAAFFIFAGIADYTIFDGFSNSGNVVYWMGLASSRLVAILSLATTVVSHQCDYDPNPILLDDFGNPIDEKAGEKQ
ncbi:MAG: hypothetical protein K5694_05855 [Bacilli bacterium]|nr:hypothetical protein [Bacilli bacterium]